MRFSILDPQSGGSQVFARDLGTSLPACSLGERRIDWKRSATDSYCLLRVHRSETPAARSERAFTSQCSTVHDCTLEAMRTQFRYHHAAKTPSAHSSTSILLKLMNVTIFHKVMRLGVIINLLIWVVLSDSTYLRPGAAPVQASHNVRSVIQSAQESNSLEPGKPIQRDLSGGQTHFYKITMTSGQFLHIVVKQQGIDVAVALIAPDDKKISKADSDHLIEGSETVSAITEAPGAYMIEVHSPEKTAKAGRYEINVEELRA